MAENIKYPELKRFYTTRNYLYSYVPGRHLSIEEVFSILSANKDRLSGSGKGMLETLKKVESHHFQHLQVSLPVHNIKHVTERAALYGICAEEGFRIKLQEQTLKFRDLSYWSADISAEDLEEARQRVSEKVKKVNDLLDAGKLREEFGSSWAFTSDSFYGNFKFSFPLAYLLDLYKDQHCGGKEPQMRILCTSLFKLEIAHCIVVHSPDTDKFKDFPEVPTVQGSSDLLPFVYWKDGTLYWRPESTSENLSVIISEDGSFHKQCWKPCDAFTNHGDCCHTERGIFGVWNYLTLAFHLPSGHLKIPREQLVKNLTACDIGKVHLGKDRLSLGKAEKTVQELKKQPWKVEKPKSLDEE